MSSQYYLGIAGEQTGPFTEQELRAKIKSSEVPEDALVWHDALDDWQPIKTVPELWSHFKGAGPSKAPPKPKGPKKKSLAAEDFDAIATFATSDASLEPAFRNDGKPTKKRNGTLGLSLKLGGGMKRLTLMFVLLFVLGAAGFFFVSGGDTSFLSGGDTAPITTAPPSATPNGWTIGGVAKLVGLGDLAELLGFPTTPEPVATPVPTPMEARRKNLKKAQEDLMVNPEGALAELRKIIQLKSDDETAKAATDAAVNYLQSVRRYNEAGKLFLETKRPAEAVTMFLEQPKSFDDADRAMMAAADMAKDDERRKWLVKSVDLFLEGNADAKRIEERVRQLEKEFPAVDHPYKYYLKSDDEKIADIFHRLSFAFVQSLLQYVATEFPQLALQNRPSVSVVREANDKYRIVGRYTGAVQLSRDVLPNVKFVFWGHNNNWYLVETDVTDDRRRFAVGEKKRRQEAMFTAKELLSFLEGMFRQRYPGAPLHETQEAAEKRRATSSE